MSMLYCHEHDRHWDTDFNEACPECEVVTPINTVELLHPATEIENGGLFEPWDMYTLAAKYVGPEDMAQEMGEKPGVWREIYASDDLQRVIEDAMDMAHHEYYRYAIRTPFPEEDA